MDHENLVETAHLNDIQREIARLDKVSERHLLWALLGATPASGVIFTLLMLQDQLGLGLALAAGVTGIQLVRWLRSRAQAKRLRGEVEGRDRLPEPAD